MFGALAARQTLQISLRGWNADQGCCYLWHPVNVFVQNAAEAPRRHRQTVSEEWRGALGAPEWAVRQPGAGSRGPGAGMLLVWSWESEWTWSLVLRGAAPAVPVPSSPHLWPLCVSPCSILLLPIGKPSQPSASSERHQNTHHFQSQPLWLLPCMCPAPATVAMACGSITAQFCCHRELGPHLPFGNVIWYWHRLRHLNFTRYLDGILMDLGLRVTN